MTKDIPQVAVLGCGHWGKNLIRNFHQLGALKAICDNDEALVKQYEEQYSVTGRTLDDILADPEINGVVIATPAPTHANLACKAIEAGKNVFIEKPLATSMQDAERILQTAEKAKKIVMVGHLLQYHPAFIKLSEMVKSGEIGAVKFIRSNRISFGKIRNQEDVIWSFAPHDISMVLSLAGSPPQDITTAGQCVIGENHLDVATIDLDFGADLQAQINVSWISSDKEQKLTVIGDKGILEFDDRQDWDQKISLTKYEADKSQNPPVAQKEETQFIALPEAEPLSLECGHFLDCIKSGKYPKTNGQEAQAVLHVLMQADTQMKQKMTGGSPAAKGDFYVHESAYIDDEVQIGKGTKIWHFSHVLSKTNIGENVIVGQNCMLGPDVNVGNKCKIQNNVSLYKGVTLEDEVFCGPSCVFTNVDNPRAGIERKDEFRKTLVRKGTTIGANATIVCGTELGEYCFIAAGAVVTKDVPAHGMMMGVPARRVGWMSHAGIKLGDDLVCPQEGRKYKETDGKLEEISNVEVLKSKVG